MSYKAFISYSHAADGKLAPALQSGLQRIAKPFYRLRAMRVFRDETSLHLTPKLWVTIQQSIHESENFILMASPLAADSKWVNDEVNEWLQLKNNSLDNFHLVLTEGEIFWDKEANDFDWEKTTALPKILQRKFETEPLYLDFRWARESEHLSLRNPRFLNSVGRLAAAIRNEPLDSIIGEDVRQHRVFRLITSGVIVALLFLVAATSYAAYYANEQTGIAIEQKAEADRQRDDAIKARNETKEALDRETKAKEGETQAKELAETKRKEAEQATNNEKSARNQAEERRKQAEEATDNERIAKNQAEERRKQAEQATENERLAKIQSDERRKEAETQTERANEALRDNYIENGRYSLLSESPIRAAIYLNEAYQIPLKDSAFGVDGKASQSNIFNLQFLLGQSLRSMKPLRYSIAEGNPNFSPDGKRIVTFNWDRSIGTTTVKVANMWDAETGAILHSFEHQGNITSVAFSSDGSLLATASFDMTIKIWNVNDGILLKTLQFDDIVGNISFSQDGEKIVAITFGSNSSVDIKNVRSGDTVFKSKPEQPFLDATFSYDATKILISVSLRDDVGTDMLGVWDAESGELISSFKSENDISFGKLSPDGSVFAVVFDNGNVSVFDSESGQTISSLPGKGTVAIDFSPDGSKVLTADSDSTTKISDVETGDELVTFIHPVKVSSVRFSVDGSKVVTVGRDNMVRLWNAETGTQLLVFEHPVRPDKTQFSNDGSSIFTSDTMGNRTWVWDLKTLGAEKSYKHEEGIRSAGFSNNGKQIITACWDGKVRVWDTSSDRAPLILTNKENAEFAEFAPVGNRMLTVSGRDTLSVFLEGSYHPSFSMKTDGGVRAAHFSSDGTKILSLTWGGVAEIWSAESGKRLSHTNEFKLVSVEFSSGGKNIVGHDYRNVVTLDAESGQKLSSFKVEGIIKSTKVSSNGKYILSVGVDSIASIWDLTSGQYIGSQKDYRVGFSVFSPDDSVVMSVTANNFAQIWDPISGKPRFRLDHQEIIKTVAFSTDGKLIVTIGGGYIRFWDVNLGKNLSTLKTDFNISFAVFSPDNQWLLTTAGDEVKVWNISPELGTPREIKKMIEEKGIFSFENGISVARENLVNK